MTNQPAEGFFAGSTFQGTDTLVIPYKKAGGKQKKFDDLYNLSLD